MGYGNATAGTDFWQAHFAEESRIRSSSGSTVGTTSHNSLLRLVFSFSRSHLAKGTRFEERLEIGTK